MIIVMTTAALIGYSPMTTGGASEIALFVARQRAEQRQNLLQSSYYFGSEIQELKTELYSAAEECKSANWDGQGAAAVSDESYRSAFRFLEALPLGCVPSSVGVEPDGEMTLEWYGSVRRTLSISFSKHGELHYAALVGGSKAYGTEAFFGDVPQNILGLVARVMIA
jgi:hypothetical protein